MAIKRGSTANESINLPRESATGRCGRKLQLRRRRDVRTAAICKARRKTRTSLVRRSSRRSTALCRLEAVDLRVRDQNRLRRPATLRSAIPSCPPVTGGGLHLKGSSPDPFLEGEFVVLGSSSRRTGCDYLRHTSLFRLQSDLCSKNSSPKSIRRCQTPLRCPLTLHRAS